MGGLHVCLETHQKLVCLGLLDGNAQAITGRRDGGLAPMSRRMAALLHKSPGACSEHLLDVHAQAIKARRDGRTCTNVKAHGRSAAQISRRMF